MAEHETTANLSEGIEGSSSSESAALYRVLVPVMLAACMAAIIANVLILTAACLRRGHRSTPTLCFSLSLAVADAWASFFVGAGLLVNSLLPKVYGMKLGECVALGLEALRLGGLAAAALHLLALAVNHYVGIVRPLHYAHTVTHRTVLLTIALLWLLPVSFFLIYFSSVPGEGFQSTQCKAYTFMAYSPFRLTTSLIFFAPMPLMTFMYAHIFAVVQRHKRQFSRQMRSNVKAVVTTLLILGTYLIGWIPAVLFFALTCLDCPAPFSEIPLTTRVPLAAILNSLIVLKALVDPAIYAARMPEIRNPLSSLCSLNGSPLSRVETLTSSLRLVSLRNKRPLHPIVPL